MATKTLECGDGGWHAVVYEDDDRDSGYGDHARVGYWFGTREQCEAVAIGDVDLYPVTTTERSDPFDLACERRHDAE